MRENDPAFDLAALEEGQPPLESPPGPAVPGAPSPNLPDLQTPLLVEKPPEVGGREEAAGGLLTEEGVRGATPPPPTIAPAAPSRTPAPPETAPSLTGLTRAEVAERVTRGLTNVDTTRQRRDRDIIRENVFTYFNTVLGSLIAVLFILAAVEQDVGNFQDGIFVGLVVMANVAVGTYQEIRATHTLRKYVALTAPRTTVIRDGKERTIPSDAVVQGDLVRLRSGDQVAADGRIVWERAEIDESLLTGESASVRKGPGEELLSGSFCTSGGCYYRAERVGNDAYAMRLTADARQLVRRETPLQLRFRRILRVLLIATALLGGLLLISSGVKNSDFGDAIRASTATIVTVVPEGLLLAMTVALAAGAVRLGRAGAVVQDIHAVEALNYVDVVCFDKTGTITANALRLRNVHWAEGGEGLLGWLGAFSVATAEESKTARALAESLARWSNGARASGGVPFSSERRWSAVQLALGSERRTFVLGAPESVLPHCANAESLWPLYETAVANGLRAVVWAEAARLPDPQAGLEGLTAAGLVTLADALRPEITETFGMMAELGMEPKIISGDNPQTVAALVRQLPIRPKGGLISGADLERLDAAGFAQAVEEHSIFGRIAPAQKARIIGALQEQRHFVAMVGDGTNDVRALRAADVAVAMASGSSTARAVSGIILRQDSFHAFIRGTAIARSVLGNSAQLSKLYLTKSFYAFLIIVATNMLGLDFPFLPRHGSLTALLSLGLPAIFIAFTKPPASAGRDFSNNVLRFAVPASLALTAAAVTVHLLAQGFLGRSIEDARTMVSLTIGIVGIYYMVQIIGFDGARRDRPLRPILVSGFGALLFAAFLLIVYTSWFRDFFDFRPVGGDEWAIVIPAVLAAMGGHYLISRYWRQIMAWVINTPAEAEIGRGRSS